jgi:hypothetical protein
VLSSVGLIVKVNVKKVVSDVKSWMETQREREDSRP